VSQAVPRRGGEAYLLCFVSETWSFLNVSFGAPLGPGCSTNTMQTFVTSGNLEAWGEAGPRQRE
jgi:hypothetical protein